jgi:hypothetical protein
LHHFLRFLSPEPGSKGRDDLAKGFHGVAQLDERRSHITAESRPAFKPASGSTGFPSVAFPVKMR